MSRPGRSSAGSLPPAPRTDVTKAPRCRLSRAVLLLLVCISLAGCAGLGRLDEARTQYYSGHPDEALATLQDKEFKGRNRLLSRLDAGLIAHMDGQYARSRDAFFEAVAIIDELDKISVGEQASAAIVSDWASSYRGEYSERLWIHTFQMMNFLLLGDPEGAAVEARQSLKVYGEFGESLRDDWFTRALIATSFAAAGQFASAHIEYARLIDDLPAPYDIDHMAALNALRAGRFDAAETFDASLTSSTAAQANGELIVFVSRGAIPRKLAGDLFVSPTTRVSFPYYPDSVRRPVRVTVQINGGVLGQRVDGAIESSTAASADAVATELVTIARTSLEARAKTIAARQAVRAGTKYQIGRAARREDEVLGAFVTGLLFLLERADTRSWETLPGELIMVRVGLPAGTHDVAFTLDDGGPLRRFGIDSVEVRADRPTFRRFALAR